MLAIIKYVILTARRDQLFFGLLCLLLLILCVSSVISSTSIVEESQTLTTIISGSCSYTIIFGMIVFCCFHIKRSYENKEIDLFLSKPISRFALILSYLLGLISVSLIIIIPFALFIITLQYMGIFYGSTIDYLLWSISLFLELSIVITFAVFASFIMKSAINSVFATAGFYMFSKMLGMMLLIINNPIATGVRDTVPAIAKFILTVLTYIFPRLDLFTKTQWLTYGFESANYSFANLIMIAIIYNTILFLMALYDFYRQEF
jgi:ABC-type transport system involved in multi-copper enzyme maturation permease subunit